MAGTADGETDLLASSLLARRQNGVLESINTIFVARTQWRSHIGVVGLMKVKHVAVDVCAST